MRCVLIFILMVMAGGPVATHADDKTAAAPPGVTPKVESPTNVISPAVAQPPSLAPRSIEEVAGSTSAVRSHDVAAPAPAPAPVDWAPIVQAMQLMIDQQKLALEAMEKAKADSVAGAKRDSEAMEGKLTRLEDALTAQRTDESDTINRMNRLVVAVAAGFASTGFVVMILTAWFFMRTVNRVAEINANIQSQLLALPHSSPNLVGAGDAGKGGNQRLLGALEQLERRIRDLEQTTGGATTGPTDVAGGPTQLFPEPSLGVEAEDVDFDADTDSPSVSALMAKGQTLLNLDDAEQALNCFDAALKREPHNIEALLKKGTALERMRRMQEALDAYDEALKQDDSLTMAYLAKGGICNRLERYAEALECYERALRVQQQGVA